MFLSLLPASPRWRETNTQSEVNQKRSASEAGKRLGRWTAGPRIDCGVSARAAQRDDNTWQKCRQHLFHAAFNSAGIMIKGNNQNECEHDKGSDAMGYYSPTGNDWALTGGWLNKLCSSLQRPRPLLHLPASCGNLFVRLAETTDRGADKHGNERMDVWSSWWLYFCALLFFLSCIILPSLNIVMFSFLFFFAWRCNFVDKHLRWKKNWHDLKFVKYLSPLNYTVVDTVVAWRRESVSPKTTMWKK